MALKTEAIGTRSGCGNPIGRLRHTAWRPFDRAPTKTEQADLLQALFGRNSEAPIPIWAAATPSDCFWAALEASRIAVKYMVPVILLSEGYLANGAEPWRIPDAADIPEIPVKFATEPNSPNGYLPYKRRSANIGAALGGPRDAGGWNTASGAWRTRRQRQYQLRTAES